MIHSNIKISTSNQQKLREYKDMNLNFEVIKGKDLKEVKSDALTVAIYKAIDAGKNILVEDTILKINDKEIVDIRWKFDEVLKMDNPIIEWIVNLSIVDNDYVYVYTGVVHCDFIQSSFDPFGPHAFDPFLKPKGINETFYELDLKGIKKDFSPRSIATKKLLSGNYSYKEKVSKFKKWNGEYQ